MSTVGLIVEYNPLHNGHLYHLQQSKMVTGADGVVAVMSGHFLQRGEPALADKWARAEMALRAGCDVVLELPVAYSVQNAQWFAYGAVALLDASGIVDALCFGSESGNMEALSAVADMLAEEPAALTARLDAGLKLGLPYPSAYTAAAKALLADRGMAAHAAALEQPNHTLGLHYLLALRQLRSPIVPYTIRREKSGYTQTDITDARIASATALRNELLQSGSLEAIAPYIPSTTCQILQREWNAGRAPLHWESFSGALFHTLLRSDPAGLATMAEVTEGLEHRLYKSVRSLPEWRVETLLDKLKTKRYTRTKLQRMLVRILLGHTKDQLTAQKLADGITYIRVLGFTRRGQSLLRDMRKRAKVPIIHTAARGEWAYLDMDARASAVYALASGNPDPAAALRDYTMPPVQVDSSDA